MKPFDFTTVDRSKVTFAPYTPTEEELRALRDELLASTDKYMLPDYPLSEEQRKAIVAYRQELRDITKNPSFPLVDLPQRPF